MGCFGWCVLQRDASEHATRRSSRQHSQDLDNAQLRDTVQRLETMFTELQSQYQHLQLELQKVKEQQKQHPRKQVHDCTTFQLTEQTGRFRSLCAISLIIQYPSFIVHQNSIQTHAILMHNKWRILYLADAWLSICVTSEVVFAQHSLSDCVQWRQWLVEVSASLAGLVSPKPFPSSSCYQWSNPRHGTSCLLEHCEVHMHCSMIGVAKTTSCFLLRLENSSGDLGKILLLGHVSCFQQNTIWYPIKK